MLQKDILLSIVIPVFNEQACLPELIRRLEVVRAELAADGEVEFMFVDDGSSDGSREIIRDLSLRDSKVRAVFLSRNFGHQIAVTAGIDHAKGDYVAIIDADLQDPPELIVPMLRLAEAGNDVVFGQRRSRAGDTAFKRLSAALFYRVIRAMCDIDIPRDTGDFRVISRRVAEGLRSMRERHRFVRGMVPWLGYKSAPYSYDRDERHAGTTKYPLARMIAFAANAILSFSAKPLGLAIRLGLATIAIGITGACYMIYLKLFTDIPVPGVTAILLTIIIFGGAQLMLTGLVGEYVARIFEEAKNRPLYVIAETRNG
ncbi:MAG: glycosyltransferase family 2 protein [Pseudomonadota bacterium]